MSEPSSAYSYEDLILRVAREAGIAYYGSSGSEAAMIPIDAHDIDLCKRIVDDGIKMFVHDAPSKGWKWMRRTMAVALTATRITGTVDSASTTTLVDATLTASYDTDDDLNGYWVYVITGTGKGSYAQITDYTAATGTCTVAEWLDANGNATANSPGTTPVAADTFAITPVETISGDIARYPLAENFGGQVDGEIHYSKDTSHSSVIKWCDEALIRARRAVTVNTGYPLLAAIKPLEPVTSSPSNKRRWELFLDPQPVAADTLEFPYTLFFNKLQLESGDSSAGDSTTLTDSSIANLFPVNYFRDWVIKVISGTGKYSYGVVTASSVAGVFTVADWLYRDGSAGGTDPAASSAYVVQPEFNNHPAGFRFDKAILAACLAQAEIDIEDIEGGYVASYNKKDIVKAIQIDTRSAPRSLGTMNRAERHDRERTWSDITYT